MPGLETEIKFFMHAVVSGICVYGFYMGIRIFRRMIKHNLWAISLEDFLFWFGTSFYLFIRMYETSGGSVRWFFVLGVVLGMVFLCAVDHEIHKILGKIKNGIAKKLKTS